MNYISYDLSSFIIVQVSLIHKFVVVIDVVVAVLAIVDVVCSYVYLMKREMLFRYATF
jgi:hypothetical protein